QRPLKVAIMEFQATQPSAEDASVRDVTRTRVESLLCQIGKPDLDVISKDRVHFDCKDLEVDGRLPYDQLFPCAKRLSIHKMVAGEMSMGASDIALSVRVVDVGQHSGNLDGSFDHTEPRNQLDKLQTDVAASLLELFHVKLTPERSRALELSRSKGTSEAV